MLDLGCLFLPVACLGEKIGGGQGAFDHATFGKDC